MEGLGFPLCLLRSLFGTRGAVPDPSAPSYPALVEGVVSVLMRKHVRHKGLGKGSGPEGQARGVQEQLLVSPSSPPLSQVNPSHK